MAQNQLNRQLAAGIRAAQQGDSERARELLEGVLRQDRNNEQGWIWLASVVDSQRERRLSLERVIKINPNNRAAQQALNSMVGVLSGAEAEAIDYAAISASARTPVPNVARRSGGGGLATAQAQSGGGPNYIPLLVGAAVILGVLLLGSIFIPPLLAPDPTATPIPTEIPEELPTVDPLYTPPPPTIRPTSTFDADAASGVAVDVTSPPTFTPTATIPPTETPLPTATLPPLTDYNFILTGIQGSASSSIYRLNGDGTGLASILTDVDDFDYNPATGLLVFTNRTFIGQPTQEVLPTAEPVATSATSSDTQSTGGLSVESLGVAQLPDLLQFQMFVTNINDLDSRTEVTSSALPSAFAPSISADGNFIAFASDIDGDAELYVYNMSTGLSSQITDNTFEDTHPDWSPDGTQLIFSSDRQSPGSNDIFIIDPFAGNAESTVEQITESRGRNIEPQWSPLTDEFVFLNINGDATTVRMASIDGSISRDLTFQPTWTYTNPSWTQDSNYILYSSAPPNSALELRIYTPLTRTEQTVRTVNFSVLNVLAR